jgi:hypothetical protein
MDFFFTPPGGVKKKWTLFKKWTPSRVKKGVGGVKNKWNNSTSSNASKVRSR